MKEAEWQTCTDPMPMLELVRGEAGERKLRLFAAAAFRRLAALLPDPRQRTGIEMLETLAEGTIPQAERQRVAAEVRRAIPPEDRVPRSPSADDLHYVALMLYPELRSSSIAAHAVHASAGVTDCSGERQEQAGLMRCLFGIPFRPVIVDSAWLTPQVLEFAQSIYDQRSFDPMPELADALAGSGCSDDRILHHCLRHGGHARGCWVVDSILGKS